MAEKYQNTVVGAFVLVAITILGGLIVAFGGGRTIFTNTYQLEVLFPQGVDAVQSGQGVTFKGKRVGETRDLKFIDKDDLNKGVIIVVRVDGYKLPAASEMVVAAPVMGLGKPLMELRTLDVNDPRLLPTDDTAKINGRMLDRLDQLIPPRLQNTIETTAVQFRELAAALRPVAANFNRLIEQRTMADVDTRGAVANIDTAIQRLDTTLKSLNEVIGDSANRQNIADILVNTKKMSESGIVAMKNAEELTAQGKDLISGLVKTTEQMSLLLSDLHKTASAFNNKEGTIGLMVNDNRLYEEILLSAKRLTKLLDDLREVADTIKREGFKVKL